MMSIFATPFFTLAGQKERLSNVASTLKAALTGQGVVANTPSPTANKLLSAAASNPFVTAGVAAVAVAPTAALGAVKAGFGSLSPVGKVAAVAGTPVVIGAFAANPSLVGKTAKAPSDLARFGGNVGSLIGDPSFQNFKDTVRESPIISGVLAAAGAAAIGGGIIGTVATIQNTRAIREGTQAIGALPSGPGLPEVTSGGLGSLVPLTPETQVLGREVSSGSVQRARAKRKTPAAPSVRINLLNQQTYIS